MNAGFLITLIAYTALFAVIGVALRHVLENIGSLGLETPRKPSRRV
jgi:hypothetical protein